MMANFCAYWSSQLTVQHNGLGIDPFPFSDGKLRIVAKYRADTHQNTVMQATKLMSQASGFLAAKAKRFSGTRSDAAIPALCIGQRYKRSSGDGKSRCAVSQPTFNLLI